MNSSGSWWAANNRLCMSSRTSTTTSSADALSNSGQQETMYANVTTKLSCSRPILIKSYSTIDSRKVIVKIMRLEAVKTVSVCLDMVQGYALEIKRVEKRVIVYSTKMTTHTRCLQVVKERKKPLNILQGLMNSQ